ncbi:MAG TPA: hypothetical protein VFT14_02890 [Solirubrobacterales bacterium]|nr:hypothetical protein [Solirubrobacterales bacterium]
MKTTSALKQEQTVEGARLRGPSYGDAGSGASANPLAQPRKSFSVTSGRGKRPHENDQS